ncbi:transcriptional regulator [Microcoleus sp. LEGE 07076]|uniref:helix-turn-helix domain-containing transcriptional regulator n=1 Tax=Microcoleus sp. LEGE 07076 TaxID=915322 RepID=UPI0018809559|nr:transcriptional regulator [Microcoleus sp. LEGE 07076]MBE9185386.1 transcriptional regulator [Microcoleus sp. LEGE 07076]
MKNVTAPTSDSWLNALIESLKNPAEAAAYLSVALEVESPDSQLLRAEFQDVIDARLRGNNLSKEAQMHHQKLDKIISESGASEIYTLIALLDALGFKLRVILKEDELEIGE